MRLTSTATAIVLLIASATFAQSGWVEDASGDLSSDPATPTPVAPAAGPAS